MAANSKIEWTTHTFNPWIGCTKVSPGCANCYAESENNRRKWAAEGWGPGRPRHRTSEANWDKVRTWNAQAKNAVERPRVFCASLADWLDDEVPIGWLADLLLLIDETPHLDWLMLTKRPENFAPRLEAILDSGIGDCRRIPVEQWAGGIPPENVWFGVSVEDQSNANFRIPELLRIPVRVRFLSCEPLLGPLDLQDIHWKGSIYDALYGYEMGTAGGFRIPKVDWVIAGGESGPNARPMQTEWVRSLRDQCVRNNTPFLFKQWGERREHVLIGNGWVPVTAEIEKALRAGEMLEFGACHDASREYLNTGKNPNGRDLDGVEWSQFPEVIR